ncbi:MAG: hypothetical protein AB8H79_21725 [Myxococcota bacterium]
MGMADEEYAYGSGNGGRSCMGISCLMVILSVVIVAFAFIVPIATKELVTFEQFYGTYVSSCGGLCFCLGSIGIVIAIVLIFTDDPEKNEQRKKERALKARRAARK